MKHFLLSYCLLLGLFASALSAQTPASGHLDRIPTLELPRLDNEALLAAELAERRPGRAPRFAVTQAVDVRPTTHGQWLHLPDDHLSWRLRLRSTGAKSLNLGFLEYHMPRGGALYLYAGNRKQPEVLGPFTPGDNEVHNQLWTQVVAGDELVVEIILPAVERRNLRLRLTHVNHDFLGFGAQSSASGSCNLDVICGTADGWGIVDRYRDIIQSVAVYSTGGTTFCTGFLVNNTRQDCTPFFMTANHCDVGQSEAPSLVTYWNFINSVCRAPNSPESGSGGDGQLNDFNTGAILRAANPTSDMTLLELDDPVSATAEAFFAGWSREEAVPTDTLVAIHHPSTDEKRISFSFRDPFRTAGIDGPNSVNGSHLEVPSWNIGTTEDGSSGSPVFDRFKRVRGQLHGGLASCSNVDYDSYGYFAVSWTGGGTPGSRLSDWLDPDGTDAMFIDGKGALSCQTSVVASVARREICQDETAEYELIMGGGFTASINLTLSGLPPGIDASFSEDSANSGDTVILTLVPDGQTSGNFDFSVTAISGTDTSRVNLALVLTAGFPDVPALVTPIDGIADLPLIVSLLWQDVAANAYEVQLATDLAFTEIVNNDTVTANSYGVPQRLEGQTTYYWRVRAFNACGIGEWSAAQSFTTLNQVCGALNESEDVPVAISSTGSPTVVSSLETNSTTIISALVLDLNIEHSFVGDLDATLTSPTGTELRLFDRIGAEGDEFGCGGQNLVLSFADDAPNTAADLETTCNGEPAANGSFRPIDPFSAFNGESALGTWILTINDNASFDGGRLLSWSLTFCGSDKLFLDVMSAPMGVCANQTDSIVLELSPDFGENPGVAATLDGVTVPGTTSAYNATDRLMTVYFSDFSALAAGENDLTLTVTNSEGTESNTVIVPLTLNLPPDVADLTTPSEGATVSDAAVPFRWGAVDGADTYTLQISTDPSFTIINFSATTSTPEFDFDNPDITGRLYWRILTNNACGSTISQGRLLNFMPTGTFEFGADRELSVFPNPVRDRLFLRTTGNWSGVIQLGVYGADGRRLQRITLPAGGEDFLDVSRYAPGVYLLRIRHGRREFTHRFIRIPH